MAEKLPAPAPGTRKCFVAYLDGHFGAHFTQKLIAKGYEVSGVLCDPANAATVPSAVRKVLRRGDSDGIRKGLLEADYIMYNTLESADDAIRALRLLSSNHFENEKRFVLVSSVMSWFETPPLTDPEAPEDDEELDLELLTEDQFNRRVPHIKYQAWRDVEKLCCSIQSERIKTFTVFAGLMYGLGEHLLGPLFRQAWSLAAEGLPLYGDGKQVVPMVHTADCATYVQRLLEAEEMPEGRYSFATDEGNCSWRQVVGALNQAFGNGKTFRVEPHDFGLHESIEHFVCSLRTEATQMAAMVDEADWVAKGGFVEHIDAVCQEFRAVRGVQPLRVVLLGPPCSGKSFTGRGLAKHYRVSHITVADAIADYRYQEQELEEELLRLKAVAFDDKARERLEEKRQLVVEERRAAAEDAAAAAADAEGEDGMERPAMPVLDDDDDDIEDDDDIAVELTPEEEEELREAADAETDNDEAAQAVQEKLGEIKRVLLMKQPPEGGAVVEPPNPKDKKKPAGKKVKKGEEPPPEPKVDPRDVRLSDRALAIIMRWKLTRPQCRNHGFIMDGFPKTVAQAKLVFEDAPIEVPEDPEEPEPPLDKEEKPCAQNIFPDYVVHAKASDTFLLERLLRVQHEHPHNTPEAFQRRLEAYKHNFEAPLGVVQWLESARTERNQCMTVKGFDMEAAPLVPTPAPKSKFAPAPVDPTVTRMVEVIGRARNFGATPEDTLREKQREEALEQEERDERVAVARSQRDKEAADVAAAQEARQVEEDKVKEMKAVERAMLEQRKGPLKDYLLATVLPVLTKGLIEVCNEKPDDPVDFLAEWLFKHNPEDHPEMYA